MTVYNATATTSLRDQQVTAQAGASKTNPQAGDTITSVSVPSAGMWEISIYAFLSGTVAAGDLNNMEVRQGSTVRFTALPTPAVAASTSNVTPFVILLNCAAADTVSVKAVGNASGASAVYNAGLVARQVA